MPISHGLFALVVTGLVFTVIVTVITIILRERRHKELTLVLQQVRKREVKLVLEVLSWTSPQGFSEVQKVTNRVAKERGVKNPLDSQSQPSEFFLRLRDLRLIVEIRNTKEGYYGFSQMWTLTSLGRDLLNHWREEDSYGA